MPFSIVEMKARARRMLHKSMSAPALYYADPQSDPDVRPIDVTVRWHNRIAREGGEFDNTEIITGIDKLIFLEEELSAKGITLSRLDEILIPDYDQMRFSLDIEEPNDGPVTTTWTVVLL